MGKKSVSEKMAETYINLNRVLKDLERDKNKTKGKLKDWKNLIRIKDEDQGLFGFKEESMLRIEILQFSTTSLRAQETKFRLKFLFENKIWFSKYIKDKE